MADDFTDRLSDYLDGEDLPVADRRQIEAHLDGCEDCRETLADLRDVIERAATVVDMAPEADLWPGVASRIVAAPLRPVKPVTAPVPAAWRISFSVPQLVAASLALMLLSGGTVWLARHGGSGTDFEPLSAQDASGPAQGAVRDVRSNDAGYDQAIADLEQILEAGRSGLSTETITVLEQNLATIDRAIAQCRAALAADPSSGYLLNHLATAQRRKLTLLRRAAALATARS